MTSVARAEKIVPMMKTPTIATIPMNITNPCPAAVEPNHRPARNQSGVFPFDVE
jgi:hypothetical protein